MKHFVRFPKSAIAVLLCCSMLATACSVSHFEAVLNEVAPAISTIIQIVAIVKGIPANTAIATKIGADVAALNKFYTDYEAASASGKAGIESDINNGFTVLNSDLSTVFAVAQVSDPNTQAKVSALISLVETAVGIAEAAIPGTVAKLTKAPANLTASALVNSFNKILVAKTGNVTVDAFTPHHKLHVHGEFVRTITLGRAH
jgi:hypothetical protein